MWPRNRRRIAGAAGRGTPGRGIVGTRWVRLPSAAMSEIVTYEADGRVAVITLNRPEARNAVNGAVADRHGGGDRPLGGRRRRVGRHPHRQHRGPGPSGLLRRRRPQGDQRRQRCGARHRAGRVRRLRLPRAAQAGDRRRRRPGHRRRLRDRPRRRPRRRHDPLVVRSRRGQAQPRRRRRRAVPPAPGDRPGRGDGGHPHRRADPRRAGVRPRPRLPAGRAGRGRSPRPAASPSRSPSAPPSRCGRAAPSCVPRPPRTTRRSSR